MILKILIYPDPKLRHKSLPVSNIDEDITVLVGDLFETLYSDSNNCGLAAPQVGRHHRITVIDTSEKGNDPLCLINPEILESGGLFKGLEACLSLPGAYEEIQRAEWVRFRAQDRNGKPYEMKVEGLLAECVQHEIDHLDGILFIDKLSSLRRKRALNRMKKYLQKNK